MSMSRGSTVKKVAKTKRPSKTKLTPSNVAAALASIAGQIKALEKRTVANVIAIGKLLYEASEKCEHGEYMIWVEREFSWSHQTALNYRNVYDFSLKFPTRLEFGDLDLSLSALYFIAGLKIQRSVFYLPLGGCSVSIR